MTKQLGGSANNTQFESPCNFLQGQIQAPPNPKHGHLVGDAQDKNQINLLLGW